MRTTTRHLSLPCLLPGLLPGLLLAAFGCAAAGHAGEAVGSVALVSPSGEDPVGGTVEVLAQVRAAAGLEGAELLLDGRPVAIWDRGEGDTLRAMVDTTVVPDGTYELSLQALFADGKTSTARRIVRVYNAGPALEIPEPLERVYHEDGSFAFVVRLADAARVRTLRMRIEGTTVEEIHLIGRSEYVVAIDPLAHLPEGETTGRIRLSAEAEDEMGAIGFAERSLEVASRRLWSFPTLGRVWEAPELLWDGAVAVVTSEGTLHVVEEDGTERCHVRADGERGTSSPTYVPGAHAIVWGTTHRLRVTDADTCAHRFTHALTREFVAKPVVTETGTIFATAFDGTSVSFEPDGTGGRTVALSEHVAGGAAMEVRSGGAAGPGGVVYQAVKLGASGGALFALHPDGAVTVADLTAPVEGDLLVTDDAVCFGARDGALYCHALDLGRRWVSPMSEAAPIVSRPALAGDAIAMEDGEGRVHGLNRHTGAHLWEHDALEGRSPSGIGLIGRAGIATGPSGDLVFADALGMVHVLGPAGEARFRVQVAGGGTGGGIVARPSVTSRFVFVGTEAQTLVGLALR